MSEKKVVANQKNAQKSTGPTTEAGKNASRTNGTKHGMCTRVVALIEGEDPEVYEADRKAFIDALTPRDEPQMALARTAFDAHWRAERCKRIEVSALSQQTRHALGDFDSTQIINMAKLADELPSDPLRVSCELRKTIAGCDWIIAKWRWLRATLDERGYWYPSELTLALNLCGKRPADAMGTDTLASELLDTYITIGWANSKDVKTNWHLLGITKPESMRESEYEERLRELTPKIYRDDPLCKNLDSKRELVYARGELINLVDTQHQRILDQRERQFDIETRDRAEARVLAGCDLTPKGVSRLRYEMSFRRLMSKSLADLARLQKQNQDNPDLANPIPDTATPYLLDITLLPEPDHFIDPRPQPLQGEVKIDHPLRSEPNAGNLTPRKPLVGFGFRDAAMNVPGTFKAPVASAWDAAGIIIDEHLAKYRLVPAAIEAKTESIWKIFKE